MYIQGCQKLIHSGQAILDEKNKNEIIGIPSYRNQSYNMYSIIQKLSWYNFKNNV